MLTVKLKRQKTTIAEKAHRQKYYAFLENSKIVKKDSPDPDQRLSPDFSFASKGALKVL